MAPHGIYPCRDADTWVAISCRHDEDWSRLADVIGETWAKDDAWSTLAGRLEDQDRLDGEVAAWSSRHGRDDVAAAVRTAGIPVAPVQRPSERCDDDAENAAWGLWPTAQHAKHGAVRVDGLPVHLSTTEWTVERAGPVLGQDNEQVYAEVLGLTPAEIGRLHDEGVI
jgi:crotonobetainyl-CoA:carnitine CoA-transferase CaiB-like acyl-CoA transferase